MNTWRASGHAKKIVDAWIQMHGSSTAPRRLPPRALRGRWGSCELAEEFLLACGMDKLPKVFAEAGDVAAGNYFNVPNH